MTPEQAAPAAKGVQRPGETLTQKSGSCRDMATLLMEGCRLLGIAARFSSGYLDCPAARQGIASTHAWAEVCVPFYGWIGLDPTNNCIASDRHVRLAIGRHFTDCTPVKGTYKGSSEHTLEVSVSIENGEHKNKDETMPVPVYTYKTKNPAPQTNSYRRYLEMQQQQQQ